MLIIGIQKPGMINNSQNRGNRQNSTTIIIAFKQETYPGSYDTHFHELTTSNHTRQPNIRPLSKQIVEPNIKT